MIGLKSKSIVFTVEGHKLLFVLECHHNAFLLTYGSKCYMSFLRTEQRACSSYTLCLRRMFLINFGLNLSWFQGPTRLISQSLVGTLEKTWEGLYVFERPFPPAIQRRVTFQPFRLFHLCSANQLAWGMWTTRWLSSFSWLRLIMDSVQFSQS